MTTLGKRIKELRENKGVRQEDIADIFGFGKSTISLWESGKNEPDYEVVVKLAEYFGVTTDYLLGHESLIKIEFKEGEGAYTASQIEKLLDDAKQALDAAVQEGHITEEQAIEAADLARQQLELIAKKK